MTEEEFKHCCNLYHKISVCHKSIEKLRTCNLESIFCRGYIQEVAALSDKEGINLIKVLINAIEGNMTEYNAELNSYLNK